MRNSYLDFQLNQIIPDMDYPFVIGSWNLDWLTNNAPLFAWYRLGHWASLENMIRYYAAEFHVILEVFTGTVGRLGYCENRNNSRTNEFLYICNERGYPMVVPEYYWKIIVDRRNKRSLGFVMGNHPSVPDQAFCTSLNVRGSRYWFPSIDKQNELKGRVFVCSGYDLMKGLNREGTFRYQLNALVGTKNLRNVTFPSEVHCFA